MPGSAADRLVTLPEEIPKLTLGWEAAKWASKYLRQPNGPNAKQRFRFVDSQIRFLLHWYAVNEDGEWLYGHGVRRLAKGSGKSPFAAVMALMELCAPVRLKDFDPKLPGGCCGRPVSMPLVQIAATAEAQTANTMRMVRAFAPKDSRVVVDHNLDPGRTRYNMVPEGTLEVITSAGTTAEGAEATFVVADETEWWLPNGGGPLLASTLLDNLAKSGNRMLETCNAWVPGAESVAEGSYDGWVDQEDNGQTGPMRVLYDARLAPPDTDMANEESLDKALDLVYGDCWWANKRAIKNRIWDVKSKPDESKRKYLNRPTSPADAWADYDQWATLADSTRTVADGERIVMFFDGSKSRDACALIGCCLSDGYVFTLGIWEPDKKSHDAKSDDRWTAPVQQIDNKVEWAWNRYTVVAFWSDVREWEEFAKLTWPQRYRDRIQKDLWAVPGGRSPEPIAWDMRSHAQPFELGAEVVEAEIRERTFRHDGDHRLSKHVRNARRHQGRYGVSVRKETPDSPDKIDGCVSLIGARIMRNMAIAHAKKERSGEAMFIGRR